MYRPPSHKQRARVRLAASLEKKLIGYAAAASAAGVGMLACYLPAEAKVVSTLSWTQISPSSKVSLDLNNDGISDFILSNHTISTCSGCSFPSWRLSVSPQSVGNAIWGTRGAASALSSGVSIGSNEKLQAQNQLMVWDGYSCYSYCNYDSAGQWKQATRKYLGFKFIVQGQIHYGWARLLVTPTSRGIYAAITKYAYETEPNTPIVTGEGGGSRRNKRERSSSGAESSPKGAGDDPGSLGKLAAGASATQQRAQRDRK